MRVSRQVGRELGLSRSAVTLIENGTGSWQRPQRTTVRLILKIEHRRSDVQLPGEVFLDQGIEH